MKMIANLKTSYSTSIMLHASKACIINSEVLQASSIFLPIISTFSLYPLFCYNVSTSLGQDKLLFPLLGFMVNYHCFVTKFSVY